MPSSKRPACQVCNNHESKYTCSKCMTQYCSVPCFKQHKDFKPPSPPLRPLTSLTWPYIPEESAYPDPLKRDDPKPLQLHQYEAIATSSPVRKAFSVNPRLKEILRMIDSLRGAEREDALQHALGVSSSDVHGPAPITLTAHGAQSEEDVRALRDLAEAVEVAVRGGKQGALGLDWGG
ncbi:uncharacterized protein PHACADRAFT_96665 [Phanerochaete carnosa HHB-10118-sp]|uniref:HIT-type domain-containing protein n=1 Tax=Phanerochaete carnosa (strain HHB-10118-sp) TaxID=650164 RepID=K5W799_PHACS|nr:uncharacterized protein PHACADRAFT_96665 [Phanerochaete carnosa HHB-10118-sp]EKM54824.1 hypothetical protein PHACADRAFT_96665 [Phanerochaete carnosa HHB-10118-sp]